MAQIVPVLTSFM